MAVAGKLFEAMAMQRPIIMGVKGESAEIVRQSGSGIEMQPSNAQSLVDSVQRLHSDKSLYDDLSQHGRDFVLNQFSRDRFADDYLKMIQKVVDAK